MFSCYFSALGERYICGGDWNSKHTDWGSRCITTRGRELKKVISVHGLRTLSTGEPTYWPTDRNKIPDLLDFFIIRGLSDTYYDVESCLDSTSDHSPIIGTFSTNAIYKELPTNLYNTKTDWNEFADWLEENINLKVNLKSAEDIEEATFYITNKIQEAAWQSTPQQKLQGQQYNNIPLEIRCKISEKRKLRRRWQFSRLQQDRKELNRTARELKAMIRESQNKTMQERLASLTATKQDNYSLWKITKGFRRPQKQVPPLRLPTGAWARKATEKAELFAQYLAQVFTPNPSQMPEFEVEVRDFLNSDQQMSTPLKSVTPKELWRMINNLDNKKAPGFDLISGEVLKHLPRKAVVFLTMLFNSVMRTYHYPKLWKVSQICMIPKPGKPPTEPSSYRPISLLPTISKLFEKCLLLRLKPVLEEYKVIPDHQFGFRQEHSTIEQAHRVVSKIRDTFEKKEYCAAVFLDIQQAFDRVWHDGLLFKMKHLLPNSRYMLLKSYIQGRKFQVRFEDELSDLYDIHASVPQGSVLGPILYLIYAADMPTTDNVITATYADDTACLVSDQDPNTASQKLQVQLQKINNWLIRWRLICNASKSTQITFTLRKGDCAPVTMGDKQLPVRTSVRYLGLYLDKRLTWQNHIKAKRTEANLVYRNFLWLIGRQSRLSLENKILVYKAILKPIWCYGIQLWGSASNSNLEILQRFQNTVLRAISNSPWFVRNKEIHNYLDISTIKEEAAKHCTSYKSRLQNHSNILARELLNTNGTPSRLKRWLILELDQRQ